MLKKIAASSVIAVGATAFLLSAGPVQANEQPVPPASSGAEATNPYGAQSTMGAQSHGEGSRSHRDWRVTIFQRNIQKNEANTGIDLCGAEILEILSNLAQGQRNEQGKCAKASFNSSPDRSR